MIFTGDNMIKGIIFDADGTLLDSMHFWLSLMGNTLKKYGVNLTPDFIGEIEYMSPYEACDYTAKRLGLKITADEMLAEMAGTIKDFYGNKVQAKPGAEAFLRKLRDAGIKMIVATGTDTPLVSAGLERCGLLGYFIKVISCADTGARKNEPDIYRAALEMLGLNKDEVIVLEDALYCAETAVKDGFRVTAVYDESEKEQDKLKSIADFYIEDYGRTEEFFEKYIR